MILLPCFSSVAFLCFPLWTHEVLNCQHLPEQRLHSGVVITFAQKTNNVRRTHRSFWGCASGIKTSTCRTTRCGALHVEVAVLQHVGVSERHNSFWVIHLGFEPTCSHICTILQGLLSLGDTQTTLTGSFLCGGVAVLNDRAPCPTSKEEPSQSSKETHCEMSLNRHLCFYFQLSPIYLWTGSRARAMDWGELDYI